jgi:hypothetical protein
MSNENDGWKPITPITGDGDRSASGKVETVMAHETRPCCMCRSWEKDEHRLIEHFIAHGLKIKDDGTFITPIALDFPGRKSLVLNPKKMGFCRLETRPTDDLATCERWSPVTRVSDLSRRIVKGK